MKRRTPSAPDFRPHPLKKKDFLDLNGRPAPWVEVSDLRRRPSLGVAQAIVRGAVVLTRKGEPVAVMLSLEHLILTALGLSEWRAGNKLPSKRRPKPAARGR